MTIRCIPIVLAFAAFTTWAPAGQGPAAASGACAHVIGPVGSDGKPMGFTCSDVGGSALLVWNAGLLSSNVAVTGGIKAVHFYPGSMSVDGTFTSNGSLGFIGGSIAISGSIIAPNIVPAGVNSTSTDVGSTLLGPPPSRLVATSTARVTVRSTGKVKATSGNAVIAGSTVTNDGQISAPSGTVMVKTGSKLDIGWTDVTWLEGVFSRTTENPINNTGSISASDIVLEARRRSNATTINNSGTLTASHTITLITGYPGASFGDGTYVHGSFGIASGTGKLITPTVVIGPYFVAPPGGSPQDRVFNLKSAADRAQLDADIGGTSHPTQDDTPAGSTAVINTSTPAGTTTSPTFQPTLVIPPLTASLTHMNSTSVTKSPMVIAKNETTETLRGESKKAAPPQKPRVKARPVLVRGVFFDSKISANITPSR